MSTRNRKTRFLGVERGRRVRLTTSPLSVSQLSKTIWDPQHLSTLQASTDCYGYSCALHTRWSPLWSSGQSSCLQIQRPRFDSRHYHIFWEVTGLERDPLSLVSTTEELLGRKSSGSGLENREYCRGDPLSWPRNTFYPQKLALTSPTSGGPSVDVIRPWTKATGLVCFVCLHTRSKLLALSFIMHFNVINFQAVDVLVFMTCCRTLKHIVSIYYLIGLYRQQKKGRPVQLVLGSCVCVCVCVCVCEREREREACFLYYFCLQRVILFQAKGIARNAMTVAAATHIVSSSPQFECGHFCCGEVFNIVISRNRSKPSDGRSVYRKAFARHVAPPTKFRTCDSVVWGRLRPC
jgi:hypothetical protein